MRLYEKGGNGGNQWKRLGNVRRVRDRSDGHIIINPITTGVTERPYKWGIKSYNLNLKYFRLCVKNVLS